MTQAAIAFVTVCAAVLAVTPQARLSAQTQPDKYPLPTKEVELAPQDRDTVLSAKTAVVFVSVRPLITRKGKTDAVVTYRAGREGPDAARREVEQALKEWGALAVVDDPAHADLVLVVLEETLPPSFGSQPDIRGPKYRLRDTLVVIRGRTEDVVQPMWVGISTESGLKRALSNARPSAKGVVEEFRRAVEDARKRARK